MLSLHAVQDIHRMSHEARPNEGCGYLVAQDGFIVSVHVTPNVHPDAATRYAVDPLAFLELDERLDGTGREVVGIVHSHPFTDAVPSPTDQEHAVPGWWYLIHGFPPSRSPVLRAWRLADAHAPFQEHPLEIKPW